MEQKNALTDIGILDPAQVILTESGNGYANMEYKGERYPKIKIARALPHKMPDKYISISDGEGKEIGIISDMAELDKNSRAVLRKQLDMIYFSPEITKIMSIVDSMGFMYFDTETVQGKRSFAVRDFVRNVRFIDGKRVQITDVDGNRYHIIDISALDPGSLKKLNTFLV